MTSKPLDHASVGENGESPRLGVLYLSPEAKDQTDGCGRDRPAVAVSTNGDAAQTVHAHDSEKRRSQGQRVGRTIELDDESKKLQRSAPFWMGSPWVGAAR